MKLPIAHVSTACVHACYQKDFERLCVRLYTHAQRSHTKTEVYFGLNTHIHAFLAEVALKLLGNRDVKLMVSVISETVSNH